MKNRYHLRSFLLGAAVTAAVMSFAAPALALASKTIEVFTGIHIYIDDKAFSAKDAKGNPVEPIVYNGTTYLPLRAVGEALGQPVQWDGATQSVYIGKHAGTAPTVYLSDLDYFTKSGDWGFGDAVKDNLGQEHTKCVRSRSSGSGTSITYVLNGQYTRLTGVYFLKYTQRDYIGECTLVISGDGRQLWRGTVGGGVEPMDIDVDLTGVLKLNLEYPSYNSHLTCLGDVALWS